MVSYYNKDIGNIDLSCPACAKAGVGAKLDVAYHGLTSEPAVPYSGDLLTDEEVKLLNNMCGAASEIKLGDIINSMLTASKEGTQAEEISDAVANMINNGVCGALSNADLGSKVQEMIEIINESGGSEANILTFVVNGIEGAIDDENNTVTVDVSHGTAVTAITPTFTLSNGATAKVGNVTQESGVTVNDFTNPVTYVVTSKDGEITKSYVVSVVPDGTIPWEEDIISHIMVFDKNVTTSVNADTIPDKTGDAVVLSSGGEPCGLIEYDFNSEGKGYWVNFLVEDEGSEHPILVDATYNSNDGLHWTLSGEYLVSDDQVYVEFTENRTEVDTCDGYLFVADDSFSPESFIFLLEFVRTTEAGVESGTIPWEEDTRSHIIVFDKNITTSVNANIIQPISDTGHIGVGSSENGYYDYSFKDGRNDYLMHFYFPYNGCDDYDIIDATYTSEDGLHWTLSGEYLAGYDSEDNPIYVEFTENRTEVDTGYSYWLEPSPSHPENLWFICEFLRATKAGLTPSS